MLDSWKVKLSQYGLKSSQPYWV